jgi:hypothetical protein
MGAVKEGSHVREAVAHIVHGQRKVRAEDLYAADYPEVCSPITSTVCHRSRFSQALKEAMQEVSVKGGGEGAKTVAATMLAVTIIHLQDRSVRVSLSNICEFVLLLT